MGTGTSVGEAGAGRPCCGARAGGGRPNFASSSSRSGDSTSSSGASVGTGTSVGVGGARAGGGCDAGPRSSTPDGAAATAGPLCMITGRTATSRVVKGPITAPLGPPSAKTVVFTSWLRNVAESSTCPISAKVRPMGTSIMVSTRPAFAKPAPARLERPTAPLRSFTEEMSIPHASAIAPA